MLLQRVRKLYESGGLVESSGLPADPDSWLDTLRARENSGTERAAEEYRKKHGADWAWAMYLDRYQTMAPLLHKLGLRFAETQQPVIPLEKSGWPWTTGEPQPKEDILDGSRGSEEVRTTHFATLKGPRPPLQSWRVGMT